MVLPAPPKVDVGWMGGEGAGLREEEVLGDAEELLVVRVSEESRKKAVYIKDLSTSGLHQKPVNTKLQKQSSFFTPPLSQGSDISFSPKIYSLLLLIQMY